ncbi:hypothetical protein K3495_g4934 [Podosphaera aphanis]|nr:hypothetical protein K3495_g4934 [Podosphaera aphanis]
MGEKSATFEIISAALRMNVISSFKKSFVHLERLAEDGDQQAMMLLGKVFFHTKTEKDALPWLHKATHPPTGNLEFDGAGEALVIEGRILSKLGNISGAQALFEKAAKQLNDPVAYFYLSQMEENGSTSQIDYLLQAASMGVTEAFHNLGVIELQKLQETSSPLTKVDDYGMALEWFLVAARDRFRPSVLNLANIYKMTGQMREAEEWLKIAEEIPGLSNQVR